MTQRSILGPGAALPSIAGMARADIRAVLERVADRLIAAGMPPSMALRMAYESLLRVAGRQGPPVARHRGGEGL